MLVHEILTEKTVQSTWITDLSYNRPNKILTMVLSNGRRFIIRGISRSVFDKWTAAESKGRFFHTSIKNNYTIIRKL